MEVATVMQPIGLQSLGVSVLVVILLGFFEPELSIFLDKLSTDFLEGLLVELTTS